MFQLTFVLIQGTISTGRGGCMDIDGTEWISLREAEEIIERSRRQIWRYIHDGVWDTRAVMDNLNRQVTYVRLSDILRKKTEIESSSNSDPIQSIDKEIMEGLGREGEVDLKTVQQQLERLIANQDYQNNLIKKCLYVLKGTNLTFFRICMCVVLVGIIVLAACSIINVISD